MPLPRAPLSSRPRGESYLARLSPERRAISERFAALPSGEQSLIIGLAKAAKEDLWVFLRKRWDGAALARQALSARPSPVSASAPALAPAAPSSPVAALCGAMTALLKRRPTSSGAAEFTTPVPEAPAAVQEACSELEARYRAERRGR